MAINRINKNDSKTFQYPVTVALNHQKNLQRISEIEPFINTYNWQGINYPAEIDDWRKSKKIIQRLLLINIKKQIILLMISKGER